MKRTFFFRLLGLSLSLAVLALFPMGCTTNEPENRSSRPWNSPKSWEHGLPSMINEGR
jgi:hypothetical protein